MVRTFNLICDNFGYIYRKKFEQSSGHSAGDREGRVGFVEHLSLT
jgi:hypothetical protein